MLSIGQLSQRTGVKVATIRYYEEAGLLLPAERTAGNQRRYGPDGLQRLLFVRHARDLGFSIKSVCALMDLQDAPDQSCRAATDIACAQLRDVRAKIAKLQSLERELSRISQACGGDQSSNACSLLAALADHGMCATEH